MTGLRDDFIFSLRQIRLNPGFALVVVLTLASAMGISTALYSISDNSWSKQWPVPQSDRIVSSAMLYSVEEARFWSQNTRSFAGLSANRMSFTKHRIEGRRVFYDFVTTNYFDVLGIPIVLGRRFADGDERLAGTEPEAVISHAMWTDRFNRDPEIIGRRVAFGGSTFTVAGVAARGFEGAGARLRRHLWFSLAARKIFGPTSFNTIEKPFSPELHVFGRLLPGVSSEQAQAELTGLSQRFRTERGLKVERVALFNARSQAETPRSAQAQASLYTTLLAVAFLCMIACANVSNLMLARGHARRAEFAVRLSLGATRLQLVRQLLIEALLLALGAGALGLVIASRIPAHIFNSVPDMWEMMRLGFTLDTGVFAWTLLLSVMACVIFGLAPALSTTRLSAGQVLKDASGPAGGSLRTSLTSMQAFVSVMALGIAGLVLRSDTYAEARGLSRVMETLVLARPVLPINYDEAHTVVVKGALLERLQTVSGTKNVAAASAEPRLPSPGERADLEVSSGYFALMDIKVVAGRVFNPTDPVEGTAVISETLAKSLWPGESAIGKALDAGGVAEKRREVIGVVRDRSVGETTSYRPVATERINVFLVRDSADRLRTQAKDLAASVDPSLQIEVVSGSLWLTQTSPGAVMTTQVFGEFGALALALTAVGLFSLSEYLVRQRTREIGIRAALGARPHHILSAIFRPATRSLAHGIVAGTLAAVAAGFLMRRWDLPSGVHPLDPANYAFAALLMVFVGMVAIWRPATKAMKVEPSEALRYE
jgi:putative ABC transport system permease protein